jgi:hypothetical protein
VLPSAVELTGVSLQVIREWGRSSDSPVSPRSVGGERCRKTTNSYLLVWVCR